MSMFCNQRDYTDGSVQNCSNSNAMELLQSCTKPSIWGVLYQRQIPMTGTNWYLPQYFWDTITCPSLDTCFWHNTLVIWEWLWRICMVPLLLNHGCCDLTTIVLNASENNTWHNMKICHVSLMFSVFVIIVVLSLSSVGRFNLPKARHSCFL